ncbi:MAG: hypothetical protein AB7E47_06940 [Desulfovibrionaceae bacterium]
MKKQLPWIVLGVACLVLAGFVAWKAAHMEPSGDAAGHADRSTADKVMQLGKKLFGVGAPAHEPDIGKSLPPRDAGPAMPPAVSANETGAVAGNVTMPMANASGFAGPEQGFAPDTSGQDRVVRWAFADTVARLLAEGYYPKGSHPQAVKRGVLLTGVKSLNLELGVRMTGLETGADDLQAARRMVYDYALAPGVQRLLYSLYASRFADALDAWAARQERVFASGKPRPLAVDETRELFRLAAAQARGLGGVLASLADMDDPAERMQAYARAMREAMEANAQFIRNLQAFEAARDAAPSVKGRIVPNAAMRRAEADMQRAGDAYQRAIVYRERAKQALIAAVRRGDAASLSEDECLYTAMWAFRRLDGRPERKASLATAASLLQDMAALLLARQS